MRKFDILRAHYRQRRLYKRLYRKFGDSHKALHWSSREAQYARFRALLRIGDITGSRVLDIGCGLGDFFGFIQQRGHDVELFGYDIVEPLVQRCQQRYPRATVECRNLLLSKPTHRFDYVFSSGLFAFGNQTFFQQMVKTAFELANIGYGFNLFQPYTDRFFRIPPQETLDYCRSLQPSRLELLDDYLANDFTVFVYK